MLNCDCVCNFGMRLAFSFGEHGSHYEMRLRSRHVCSLRGYMTKYDCSSADLNPIGGICKADLKSFLRYTVNKYNFTTLTRSVWITLLFLSSWCQLVFLLRLLSVILYIFTFIRPGASCLKSSFQWMHAESHVAEIFLLVPSLYGLWPLFRGRVPIASSRTLEGCVCQVSSRVTEWRSIFGPHSINRCLSSLL